jgi:hypothetical protein
MCKAIYCFLLISSVSVSALADNDVSWRLLDAEDTSNKSTACILVTPKKSMNDGQGETTVWLELSDKELLVKTKSDIDKSFNDIAIKIDDREKIPLDEVRSNTDIVFSKSIIEITRGFVEGNSVRVQLRFWPTWPASGLKYLDFSLLGFTKTYEGLATCKKTSE